MDKINNINSIVNILRDRVDKRSIDNTNKKTTSKTGKDVKVNQKEPLKQDLLINKIQSRILKSNKNSDNHREVVMAIIAESIIVNEFGENIVNDPDFRNLLNNVIDGYKSESSILAKIDHVISKI